MIVSKHKSVSGGGFPAVTYNENKIVNGVAELMAMVNVSDTLRMTVETLHKFGLSANAEITRYLKYKSETYGNSRTTRFQLHLSASAKGKAMSPQELNDFAQELMNGIGYGNQPYFVYSHHDTDNNHIHIVTTRIQPNGKPITDHQDYRIINDCVNRLLSADINKWINEIFSFDFQTEGQFTNIARAYGYKVEKENDKYHFFKGGAEVGTLDADVILKHISGDSQQRKDRTAQLKAIIKKYKDKIAAGKIVKTEEQPKGRKKKPMPPKENLDIKKILDRDGKPLPKKTQEQFQLLLNVLKTKFGVEVYFQKDKNGQVRGYGLVDHAGKIAFDGSKVMKLSELIDFAQQQVRKPSPLDVYRDMFSIAISARKDNATMEIRMKNGTSYQKVITHRQLGWYENMKPEEKDDVAYTIAATMFSEEILMTYLKRHSTQELRDSIKAVYTPKHKNGGYCLRIEMNGDYTIPLMKMDEKYEIEFRNILPDERESFLLNLAVDYLTRSEAEEIIQHIRRTMREQIKRDRYVLPKQQDFTPQQAQIFAQALRNAISRFNVEGGSQDQNREWEVGSDGYGKIDDGRSFKM